MVKNPIEAVQPLEAKHAANEQSAILNELEKLEPGADRLVKARHAAHVALAKEIHGGDAFGYETARDVQIWFSLRTALLNYFDAKGGVPVGEPYQDLNEMRDEHVMIHDELQAKRPAFVETLAGAQRDRYDQQHWLGRSLDPEQLLPLERAYALGRLQMAAAMFVDSPYAQDGFNGWRLSADIAQDGQAFFYEIEAGKDFGHESYSIAKYDVYNLTVDYEDRLLPLEFHQIDVNAGGVLINGQEPGNMYADPMLSPSTFQILEMADHLEFLASNPKP